MRRNAAKAGLALLAASGLGALTAGATLGGDRALADFIGYSDDGRYFAFEEYGVQDGSGFPYATIYVIDLAADRWVPGSPYRIRLESEDADVEAARDDAHEQAEPKLDELEIGGGVDIIALNGDGEPNDGRSLRYGRPGYGLDAPADLYELTLETFPADSPENCETYLGERALGYALIRDGEDVYRDTGALPRSRGCPLGYRIHAVVAPPPWLFEVSAPVAIVSVYPFGFEGPDRRFLAVPLPGDR